MKPLEWTSDDAKNLREFLETDTGERLIPYLYAARPSFLDRNEGDSALIRSGKIDGYEEAIVNLQALTEHQINESITENYPSIDDDSKWDDENKK